MNKPFCFTLSSPMLSFVSLGQFAGCEMASHCGLIVHLYGEREREAWLNSLAHGPTLHLQNQ